MKEVAAAALPLLLCRGPPLWNWPRGERRLAADSLSAVRLLMTSL